MNGLIYRWRALPQSLRIATVAFPVLLIIGIIVLILYLNLGYYARNMKLVKTEGYVSIVDESGENIYMRNNMRFPTGSTLTTGIDGLATLISNNVISRVAINLMLINILHFIILFHLILSILLFYFYQSHNIYLKK